MRLIILFILLFVSACAVPISGEPKLNLYKGSQALPYRLVTDIKEPEQLTKLHQSLAQLGFRKASAADSQVQRVAVTVTDRSSDVSTPRWRSYTDANGSVRVEIDPGAYNTIRMHQWHILLASAPGQSSIKPWSIAIEIYGAVNQQQAIDYFASRFMPSKVSKTSTH
ncbi:hypothetical protein [Paraferrimonas sp. SM1919]|uniref:hypothetical protein n=1 Tax=Paraferrimonas sp. SM1919 TaxID=2662263 RepID=UPI0013D62D07|nr:hypothetical protein [Paraferrimonas sp. SM1919]